MTARENWCEWHVVHVENEDGERVIEILHPDGCDLRVEVRRGEAYVERSCFVAYDRDNAGTEHWFNGIPEVGWYLFRGQNVTIRGADWSEIDTEYELVPLARRVEIVA